MKTWTFIVSSPKKVLGTIEIKADNLPTHKEICDKAKSEFKDAYTYRLVK